MARIIRAEDERRWDADLQALLNDKNNQVRRRAVLAAGRIGNDQAVPVLVSLLQKDSDESLRAMAAFALGEIESATAADALIAALSLDQRESAAIRSRAVEALGKIAAALPKADEVHARPVKAAILATLEFEARRRSAPDNEVILLGVTAALRARPDNAGKVLADFLHYSDPRVRADAANTLARLKLNEGNAQLSKLLIDDPDPIVRANAARVLGATLDKTALDALVSRGLHDPDSRVRVSAIRALGALKDERAATHLFGRVEELFKVAHLKRADGATFNEALEITATLGQILAGKNPPPDSAASIALFKLYQGLRGVTNENVAEFEIASARISPSSYLKYLAGYKSAIQHSKEATETFFHRRSVVARSAGLAELAKSDSGPATQDSPTNKKQASAILSQMLDDSRIPQLAVPDVLRAYAAFKPEDLLTRVRGYLRAKDVVIRATAAELLAELPPDEANTRLLIEALPLALRDKDLNDASLAILDALGKQKNAAANDAIKTALDATDRLVRSRAVALLKANGVGDFSARIGNVQTRNTNADYQRAIARTGKRVRAIVNTSRGPFVIEFLPEDAPLTVDNFVMLARRGYFNGQTVPRVVPNFVIQTGDPRGDQNGGPGYSIRCEVNQAPYDRGAVGMALSGKDTGGSQWFVTHSPQPHLDGGYTVFGHVISGMDVVDNIVRGDTIRSITIAETSPRATRATAKTHRAHMSGIRE